MKQPFKRRVAEWLRQIASRLSPPMRMRQTIFITDECFARLQRNGSEVLPTGITVAYEKTKPSGMVTVGDGCYLVTFPE